MNDLSKIKLLTGTTIVLIVLNIAVVSFIWFGHPPHPGMGGPGPDRAEMIPHELKFDDTQRKQFDQLRQEHHQLMETINQRDRNTHEALFELIKGGQDNSTTADSLIAEIANNRKESEAATYHHLAKLRKICTPEQQKIFDDIILNLFKHGPQGPPPPRP